MADADHVTALREIGRLRLILSLLQFRVRRLKRGVGAPMRVDFFHQQGRLPLGLLLREGPAFAGQDDHPGGNRADNRESPERVHRHRTDHIGAVAILDNGLHVNKSDDAGNRQGERQEHNAVARETLQSYADGLLRRDVLEYAGDLFEEFDVVTKLTGEISSIAQLGSRMAGLAMPLCMSSTLAMKELLDTNHRHNNRSDVLC